MRAYSFRELCSAEMETPGRVAKASASEVEQGFLLVACFITRRSAKRMRLTACGDRGTPIALVHSDAECGPLPHEQGHVFVEVAR